MFHFHEQVYENYLYIIRNIHFKDISLLYDIFARCATLVLIKCEKRSSQDLRAAPLPKRERRSDRQQFFLQRADLRATRLITGERKNPSVSKPFTCCLP